MIRVDLERCTGCGECVRVCPAGALSIMDGHALVDEVLCQGCEACLAACPAGAITSAALPLAVTTAQTLQHGRPAAIDVLPPGVAPAPWRERVLPALARVVSFTGREVLPRVLEVLASMPREPLPREQAKGASGGERDVAGGQRARRRHRGQHGRR